jgi:hypothetical protein
MIMQSALVSQLPGSYWGGIFKLLRIRGINSKESIQLELEFLNNLRGLGTEEE